MMEASLSVPADSDLDPRERIGELFDLHHLRLYRLALRMTGSDHEAQDLVQETFLRVARKPSTVPVEASAAEAWLVRILVNLSRDHFRRSRVRERHKTQAGTSVIQRDHEDEIVASQAIGVALARLSPKRRAVIVMHEIEGVPASQIAEILGVTRVTVRWHLSAGRKELAELLSSGGE